MKLNQQPIHITKTEIYRFSIPMEPFTISTGTMDHAQNVFIRVHTNAGFYGVGECSAFPMIVGETQDTCLLMAREFAKLWIGKDPLDIEARLQQLHSFTAGNTTIKSAFDMALYDIAAKNAGLPLYKFLGGEKRVIESDITIGIASPAAMAEKARAFKQLGANILKVKLGKNAAEDVERIKQIRQVVGPDLIIRVDANQGWSYDDAVHVLTAFKNYNIEFCEQPMRRHNDHLLPSLKKISPVKIMADESVFDHHDAMRLLEADACDYVNIKFAKSSGILEAQKINAVCAEKNIPCMMGGMLESRVALTAFAHFATAFDNVQFYDMDTCMLGHKVDPVTGGVAYNNFCVELPDAVGIGANVQQEFLEQLEKTII